MTSPREPNLSRISAAVRSAARADLAVWSTRADAVADLEQVISRGT